MTTSLQHVVVVLIVDENEDPQDAGVLQYSQSSELIPLSEFEGTCHPSMEDECTLVRKGRPFSFEGMMVIPYLYSTTMEKKHKFNTKSLRETHSSLQQYLLRLFLPRRIALSIRDIAEDHDSGARQLALKALDTLKLCMSIYQETESSWPKIVNCAWYITQARPSMGSAVYTTILRALAAIKPFYPLETIKIIDRLIGDEKEFLSHLSVTFANFIVSQFPSQKEEDHVNILTLSYSSTIAAALTHLFQSSSCPCMTLNILESRPLLEGVTLAKLLLPYKPSQVTIALATDASAAYLSSNCQLTILGCDHLDPETGNVKNKIGSVAAARFAKRTICVTSTDKLGIVKDETVEENDPEEVSKMWNERLEWVAVRNVYFEWVAGSDVEGYITERGILGKRELMDIYLVREGWEQIWDVLD